VKPLDDVNVAEVESKVTVPAVRGETDVTFET
jgi:hypothetical protein